MKINYLFVCMAVILLGGITFLANNASAEASSQNSDPNVIALQTTRALPPCYLDSNKNCQKIKTNEGCALCDNESIITPGTRN